MPEPPARWTSLIDENTRAELKIQEMIRLAQCRETLPEADQLNDSETIRQLCLKLKERLEARERYEIVALGRDIIGTLWSAVSRQGGILPPEPDFPVLTAMDAIGDSLRDDSNRYHQQLRQAIDTVLQWCEKQERPGSEKNQQPGVSSPDNPALSDTEKAVLEIIKTLPKGQGITGKEIISRLKKKKIHYKETTLRKHILPKLKRPPFNVTNSRANGGYLIP